MFAPITPRTKSPSTKHEVKQDWQKLYRAAIIESDLSKMLQRHFSHLARASAPQDLTRGGFGRAIHAMKHLSVHWNPATREWYCARCGRTSDHTSVQEAHVELDQYDCQLTSVEIPSAPPGTATTRLIRKPYRMRLKTERSGSRFVVTNTDDGRPLI